MFTQTAAKHCKSYSKLGVSAVQIKRLFPLEGLFCIYSVNFCSIAEGYESKPHKQTTALVIDEENSNDPVLVAPS